MYLVGLESAVQGGCRLAMLSARFIYLYLIIGSRYSFSSIKENSGAKIREIFEAGYAQNWV